MSYFHLSKPPLDDHQEKPVQQLSKGPILAQRTTEEPKVESTFSYHKEDTFCLSFLRNDSDSLPKHEISFEKNFLGEHITTIDAILQNTKESMLPASQQSPVSSQKEARKSDFVVNFPREAREFIREVVPQCQQMTHAQFIKDLRKEKDLEEFLNYLIKKYPPELTASLIVITIDIWSEVRTLNLKEHQIKNFRRLASDFSDKKVEGYYQRGDFSELKQRSRCFELTEKSVEILPRFKEVVRRISTTILLIVGGFFENPFVSGEANPEDQDEVDYPKRQFSGVSLEFMSERDSFSDYQNWSEPEKKTKRQ